MRLMAVDTLTQPPLRRFSRRTNVSVGQPTNVVGRVRSLKQIPADTTILIRAFDLAAVAAVLRLSEGRGGLFSADSPVPQYYRSGHEPHRIDIRNRSGRPMLAKPAGSIKLVDNSFWRSHRRRLNSLRFRGGRLNFRRDVWPIILQAAADFLSEAGSSTKSTDVDNWYRGWSRYQMDAVSARRAMQQSLGVATGLRPVDMPFAIGETWRNLSPQVEELVSSGGARVEQLEMYAAVREEMQCIAFGPSAAATAKLLSLLRARLVTIGPLTEIGDSYDAYLRTPAAPHRGAKPVKMN